MGHESVIISGTLAGTIEHYADQCVSHFETFFTILELSNANNIIKELLGQIFQQFEKNQAE